MSTKFDYYYSHEAEQFTFYRIPKALFTEPMFHSLSTDAKLLYGLMLDRMSLSLRSGWLDDQGRVYIYFTQTDIQEHLGCGHTKATQLLRELDSDMGLIRRKRQGLGKPDMIYVMNFTTGNQSTEERQFDDPISQESEDDGATQSAGNQTSGTQRAENRRSGMPESVSLDCRKLDTNKTEKNKNKSSETESILPIPLRASSENLSANGMDGRMGSYRDCYSFLLEKWGYIALKDSHKKSELDGVFALGADVLSSTALTVRVAQQDMPRQQVADRFLSLDFTHIDYVLDSVKRKNATAGDAPKAKPIENMRSYLLTALYNAPTTIDAYYSALVVRNEGKEVMPQTIAIPNISPNFERRILC